LLSCGGIATVQGARISAEQATSQRQLFKLFAIAFSIYLGFCYGTIGKSIKQKLK